MKHARTDYDHIQDGDGLIPDDEPVFLLRGQDPLAADAVERWVDLYEEESGADPLVIDAVRQWAVQMRAWSNRAQHGIPDVPAGRLRDEAAR